MYSESKEVKAWGFVGQLAEQKYLASREDGLTEQRPGSKKKEPRNRANGSRASTPAFVEKP